MSAVDDILFSPVGAASVVPYWRNVPIHITYVSPALLISNIMHWQGGRPSPGIHYVYPEQLNEAYDTTLKNEIYLILENCLNVPTAPFGAPLTLLNSIPMSAHCFTDDMRHSMYSMGANPICYLSPIGEILWEQNFADLNGFIAPIVSNGVIDPNFLGLVCNPAVPLLPAANIP